jgi:hypothetical protein
LVGLVAFEIILGIVTEILGMEAAQIARWAGEGARYVRGLLGKLKPLLGGFEKIRDFLRLAIKGGKGGGEALEKAADLADVLVLQEIEIDAATQARWAARGARLRLPSQGSSAKAVGELWREGVAEAEELAGKSGAKGAQVSKTELTQPPQHVIKPKPKVPDHLKHLSPADQTSRLESAEGQAWRQNKGIPEDLNDLSPAEKRKWLDSPEGKQWLEGQRLDGPFSNLENKAPHGGPRDHDAEANMFENLLEKTNRDTVGEFHFMVDRPVCPACKDMLFRFSKMRPNIRVIQHSLDFKVLGVTP